MKHDYFGLWTLLASEPSKFNFGDNFIQKIESYLDTIKVQYFCHEIDISIYWKQEVNRSETNQIPKNRKHFDSKL